MSDRHEWAQYPGMKYMGGPMVWVWCRRCEFGPVYRGRAGDEPMPPLPKEEEPCPGKPERSEWNADDESDALS